MCSINFPVRRTTPVISSFPFLKKELFEIQDMGIFTVLFAVVIVGCSNAVNLTDGLDGLASGCAVSASLAYGVCYVTGKEKLHLVR